MVAACGGDDDATSSEPPAGSTTGAGSSLPPTTTTATRGSLRPSESTVVPSPGPTTVPGPPGGPTGSAEEAEAIADLAARLGADPAAITVVSVEDVTWRDGSIGCPDPGMNYTQALVSGTRLVLELDGVRYEYHSGGSRSIFLCEKPQAPLEG